MEFEEAVERVRVARAKTKAALEAEKRFGELAADLETAKAEDRAAITLEFVRAERAKFSTLEAALEAFTLLDAPMEAFKSALGELTDFATAHAPGAVTSPS